MTPREKVRGRQRDYRNCFLDKAGKPTASGERALKDLAKFCYLHKSTMIVSPVTKQVDTHASALAEGRREVLLRILEALHLEDRYIVNLREEPPHG